MLKVAAYTGGRNVPSARFRVRQYIPALHRAGIEVREYSAMMRSYPPRHKALRPFWGAAAVIERAISASSSFRSDVTLLQREMVSTLLTAEPLTKQPRVLDVDDAIWLNRDGWVARHLARMCEGVICGNDFLAETFSQWNSNTWVLATAIDTSRYCRDATRIAPSVKTIGWSGGSSNFPYLHSVIPALRAVMEKRGDVIFRVVADRRPALEGIDERRVEFIPWSQENEVRTIQEMSIGVMPLEDTPWARGKCSFKLLTYMACGVPVVASPVGMNAQVLAAGGGLAPNRWEDWADALDYLLTSETQAEKMAAKGRRAVLDSYSLSSLAPKLAAILESCRR
jgi:glycosyltransferase involved in cell wall biosynthesis